MIRYLSFFKIKPQAQGCATASVKIKPQACKHATAALILFLLFCTNAYAQEAEQVPIPTGQFQDLKHTQSGRVDKVIDGLTILLKNKKIVRLASLDIPDFHIWRDAPYAEAAMKLLEAQLPENTEVHIYQTRKAKIGRVNRMNHELGQIVVKKNATLKIDELWINGALLANGFARVYTAPNAPEMNDQMLKIEAAARANKRGLWQDGSEFPLLTPDTAASAMGLLAVVEGTVKKVATVRNNVYLNFGADWKTDFTVMLTPALRKKLSHKGVSPLNLTNETIRVRGFVRDYNGPLIELEAIEHLELLSTPDQSLPAPAKNSNLDANP